MTANQRAAYDWAKSHPDYRSIAAVHAQELAGLVDGLMETLTKANQSGCPYDITMRMDADLKFADIILPGRQRIDEEKGDIHVEADL